MDGWMEVNRKCRPMNTMVHYNVQPPTPTLSTTMHGVTDRQTDRRQYDAKSRSYCVQG